MQEETGLQAIILKEKIGVAEYTIQKGAKGKNFTVQKIVHYFLMETSEVRLSVEVKEAIKDAKWYALQEALKIFGYENTKFILKEAVNIISQED